MERNKTETMKDKDIDKCCNPNCRKDHCAHHWRNHSKSAEAWNLNPYDEVKCPRYLAKFQVGMRYDKK